MIIVCDIDGTVADHFHRFQYVEGSEPCDCTKGALIAGCGSCNGTGRRKKKKNWEAYFDKMGLDPVIPEAARVVPRLVFARPSKFYFLTGRPERYRNITEQWLRDKLSVQINPLVGPKLHMRPDTDRRSSSLYKDDLASALSSLGHRPLFIDDDLRNKDMYEKYGVFLKAPECWSVFP